MKHNHFKEGLRVTNYGMVLNSVLIVLKALTGIFGNSFALIADSVHSLSDLLTDFILVVGLKIAGKPKDETHLYGHGKVENYLAHIIGILIISVGIGMGYTAIQAIYIHKDSGSPRLITLIAAFVSIILKEYLYRVTVSVGKKIKSQSLIANAWEHRSDAFSSMAAFIGIGCAYLNPDWHILDQYVGLLIAFFVVHVGCSIAWKSFKDIIDTSPSKSVCDNIKKEIETINGVINVHGLRARYYSSSIFLDIHIMVDPDISVKEGHDIAEYVTEMLKQKFEDIFDVTVHVEPADEDSISKARSV